SRCCTTHAFFCRVGKIATAYGADRQCAICPSYELLRRLDLDEGAETRDRLADDQCIHLARSLVGIDRLRVRDEASHVLVQQDAVSPEQFARISNRLATLHGAECLGE